MKQWQKDELERLRKKEPDMEETIKETFDPQVKEEKTDSVERVEVNKIEHHFAKQSGIVIDINGETNTGHVIGVWDQPEKTGRVSEFIGTGDKVEILGKEHGFYKISAPGLSGEKFIDQKYIKLGV